MPCTQKGITFSGAGPPDLRAGKGTLCKMATLVTGFPDKPICRFKSFYSFRNRSK